MNPEDLRQFRVNILIQGRAAGAYGQGLNQFLIGAKSAGFRAATAESVEEEIAYLQDKGQMAKVSQEISPEIESFRITAAGRDWLATQNY